MEPIRRLAARASTAPSAQPVLVLIHGLFSSPMEFGLLSRTLRARGVNYEWLEVPGYTRADRGDATDWQDWVARADAALDARFPADTPIVLGGLCVGGMIAAMLAARPRRQRVVGLALLSPTFAFDGWSVGRLAPLRCLAYWLGIDRWLSVAEREPFGIRNEKTRQWIVRDLLETGASAVGPQRLPLRGIREAERLYAAVRSRIASLRVPLLVLHARDDELASLASVETVLATATVPTRLVVLERSFHMITLDDDRVLVANTLADFTCAPPPSVPTPVARSRVSSPRAASSFRPRLTVLEHA